MNRTTIDPEDVRRFSAVAEGWWDMHGPFAPLHKFTPVRLELLREWLGDHFARDGDDPAPFAGLDILDIGCGGGLLSEPMRRLGAAVTGIDADAKAVRIAAHHAAGSGLDIEYRAVLAEALAEERPGAFDAIIASEVIEHVADPALFAEALATLVRPGGAIFLTTLNRTAKSLLFAKFAAEYLLRWVPPGTHDWRQFRTPDEIRTLFAGAGLTLTEKSGIRYDPLAGSFTRCRDTDINYALLATRPALPGGEQQIA